MQFPSPGVQYGRLELAGRAIGAADAVHPCAAASLGTPLGTRGRKDRRLECGAGFAAGPVILRGIPQRQAEINVPAKEA
jgi:hypothetical protein